MIIQFFVSNWILLWSILFYTDIVSIPPLVETIYFALFISTYLLYVFEIQRPLLYIISIIIHSLPLFFVKKYYEKKIDKETTRLTLYINTVVFVIYATMMTYFKKDILKFYTDFTLSVKNKSIFKITKNLFKI